MKVKICGISDAETALKAVEFGADALGFVFADSKRRINPALAREIISRLPGPVMKVGVFVNEISGMIEEIADYCGLTHIQLHGDETPAFCSGLKYPVIKGFNISEQADLTSIHLYDCAYSLLDSPKGKYHGGTGKAFDWNVIPEDAFSDKKIILAGGLTPGNVKSAIQAVNPEMVDVSSGVETNGKKDIRKIKEFIEASKQTGGIAI